MRVLLVVYDNASYTSAFPLNMGYLASALERAGHEVAVYAQDVHHYPDEHLTRFLDGDRFDAIGVGIVAGYYPYRKLLSISEAINASKRRPLYLIGGHGPTPEPEYFLHKTGADVVVMGEGECTIVEVLENWDLSSIRGIAYRDGDEVKINPRRPPIEDLDAISFPAWRRFPVEVYRMRRHSGMGPCDFSMPVIAGRGCPHRCTFCYRMDPGFRVRSPDNVLEEVRLLQDLYGITYVWFCDELLMSSAGRITAICERILERGMKFKWHCNGRLNHATPGALELMKRSGCVFINYGIEAVNDEVLRNMRKSLTVEQITKGIEATLAAGISPGFNMLFGNIGDTAETLERAVEFLLKYDDQGQMRTIRPVTPYPGSELYQTALERELLDGCADFYERKHLNSELVSVNFTGMNDDDFHRALLAANERLIRNYHRKMEERVVAQAKDLYLNRNAAFRGFRQT